MTNRTNSPTDAERAERRLRERIGRLPGVRGIGLTRDDSGKALIRVNVDRELNASVRASIPEKLDGVAVELRNVGVLRTFANR